jgi:hypothetical protein
MKKLLALFVLLGLQYWQGLMGFLPISMFYNPGREQVCAVQYKRVLSQKFELKLIPQMLGEWN